MIARASKGEAISQLALLAEMFLSARHCAAHTYVRQAREKEVKADTIIMHQRLRALVEYAATIDVDEFPLQTLPDGMQS